MRALVGLGNPGSGYALTRHNVGFMVVDLLAARGHVAFSKAPTGGQYAQLEVCGAKTLLFKPQSFMNLSGQPVADFVTYYKIPTESLVVVHDDLDLEFGALRAKESGGHGGHNGIRDMIQKLGSDRFHRLKVGIGRPGRGDKRSVSDWVLGAFSPEELDTFSRDLMEAIEIRLGDIYRQIHTSVP